MVLPTHADIATRAYQIWQQEGRPQGRDFDHWLRAEREILERQARQPRRTKPAAAPRIPTKRTPKPDPKSR